MMWYRDAHSWESNAAMCLWHACFHEKGKTCEEARKKKEAEDRKREEEEEENKKEAEKGIKPKKTNWKKKEVMKRKMRILRRKKITKKKKKMEKEVMMMVERSPPPSKERKIYCARNVRNLFMITAAWLSTLTLRSNNGGLRCSSPWVPQAHEPLPPRHHRDLGLVEG